MINRKEILVQAIENGFEETLEGYPIETKYSKEKNATDYTIFGNTEYSENLFNYTEPTTNSVQADENGWFDVTVDNTTGTATKTVWCTTKPNYRLKTNTQYALFVEVAEKSGSVNNVVATQWSSFLSQLLGGTGTTIVANSIGTKTATVQTRASFDDCENMLRGNVSVPAGQSGHIKFRIAVYETQKDEFIPYTKTSVGDLTDNLFNYTEPKNKDQMAADENGWFDVTIDNSNGTKFRHAYMFTKVNNKLKPDTSYTIVTEIAEYSGDIDVRPVTDYTNPSQFGGKNFPAYTTSGTFTATRTTKSTFDDSLYMLRTYCDVPAGKTGHAKFRIAVYETEKDYFEPYNKYKIPIIVNDETAATAYLDAPLADGESANYKSDNLPDINLQKDINELTTDTEVKPSKISLTYTTKVRGSHE